MRYDVSLEAAHHVLINASCPVEKETAGIDQASGRILARDVFAPVNIPPFRKSAMDGYALRCSDSKGASSGKPVRLRIVDVARAGYASKKRVEPGTAIKVMTGAVVPDGADVVLRSEDVDVCHEDILVTDACRAGQNLVMPGEDVHMGELVAPRGAGITPPLVGLLAGLGIVRVPVYRNVSVAVMSTGDELMDPSEPPHPSKIFNSSLYGIMARCREAGALSIQIGSVPDHVGRVAKKMAEGLKQADIVITTGGTSAGTYDVVEDAMVQAGADILFKGVSVKSGSPILAAKRDDRFIVSLPGNPSGAMAGFDLIVTVLINHLRGLAKPFPTRVEAVLVDSYPRFSPVRRLLHARLFRQEGVDYAELTDHHSRGMVDSIVSTNFYIDIPAGSSALHPGELVWGVPVGALSRVYSDIAAQSADHHLGVFRTASGVSR